MKKFLSLMVMLVAFATAGMADTWTVAGSAAALNGDSSWDTANEANDMTDGDADGVFELVVTDCTLETGTTYEFKVVKDHAWSEAYPASNYQFTVDEKGVYTVTYTFDSSNKGISVVTTKTGEAGDIEHTYTVAGSSTALFGTAWTPTDTNNDMVEASEGIFTWTKENVTLDGTDISFKVCVDHGWGTAYPGSNWVINKEVGDYGAGKGAYDVTITFTEETKDIAVSITKHLTTYSCTFVNTPDWNGVKAYTFTPETLGEFPGKDMDLTEELKDGHKVYSISFDAWVAPTGILFVNAEEQDQQTNDFTFTDGKRYTPVSSIDVTIGADGYASFSSEYALDFTDHANIKAYRVVVNGNVATLEQVNDKVPANTGLILMTESPGEYPVPTAYGASEVTPNALCPAVTATTPSEEGYIYYVLAKKNDVVGFYKLGDGVKVPAGKAYLKVEVAKSAEAPEFIGFNIATGIEAVTAKTQLNGQFFNLAGQRVAQPTKGLYIVNGKKVVIK